MTKRSYVDAVLAGLDEYEAAASASGALDEPSQAVRRAGCCTQSWLCAGRTRMFPIPWSTQVLRLLSTHKGHLCIGPSIAAACKTCSAGHVTTVQLELIRWDEAVVEDLRA